MVLTEPGVELASESLSESNKILCRRRIITDLPAQTPAHLLWFYLPKLSNEVLLSDCAVGVGAAVESTKVDVAGVQVGELVDGNHAWVPGATATRHREADSTCEPCKESWLIRLIRCTGGFSIFNQPGENSWKSRCASPWASSRSDCKPDWRSWTHLITTSFSR